MDIFVPIKLFADLVTYRWFGIFKDSYLGQAVNFFLYDTLKIGLLLIAINFLMAIVRYYFPTVRIRDILTKRRWFGLDYLFAALLGVVTPFCSCSSIPLFIGFLGAGIPLGVTFAFLISSPLINETSLYLFPAMFGLKVTFIYNIIGISIAVGGGYLIQKLNMGKYVYGDFFKFKSKRQTEMTRGKSMKLKELLLHFWREGMTVTKTVFPYVLVGVGVGSLIHGFVPTSFIVKYLSAKSWSAVPLATILGAPLYANSVSVIPIMEALVNKGVPLGTALSFMTAVVTVSIPEMLMLKKVMKWQLLATFLTITVVGIMVMGYVLN